MQVQGAALITGGASGIGRACCLEFARSGCRGILIGDINVEAAEKTAKDAQEIATHSEFRAEVIHLDVSDEDSVNGGIARMVETFGRIDYCVHSAGICGRIGVEMTATASSEFRRVVDNQAYGAFLVTRSATTAMKSQEPMAVDAAAEWRGTTRGCIVSVASVASYLATPGMVSYVAAKHAVLGIIRTAALENAAHGIRVNCVCPSYADTPMLHEATEYIPGLDQGAAQIIPMGRLARPEEVADGVLYLCSNRAGFVTGIALPVDGGAGLTTKI